MRPVVPSLLLHKIFDVVKDLAEPRSSVSERLAGYDLAQEIESVLPDVLHLHQQIRELQRYGISPFVVTLRDDGAETDRLPVVVQAPDLHNVKASHESVLTVLDKSGLGPEAVNRDTALTVFVDRLAEFIAARSVLRGGGAGLTTVHSNRRGDTVLYAKGYFISTGMALGISTPATGYLSGRYSFGIVDSGTPKFENTIWSCPTTLRLNLP